MGVVVVGMVVVVVEVYMAGIILMAEKTKNCEDQSTSTNTTIPTIST